MADNRSTMEKLKDELLPSLTSGLVAAGVSIGIMGIGMSDTLNLFNMNINAPLGIALAVGSGVLISELIHDHVFENIPGIRFLSKYESGIGGPLLAGAMSFGVFKLGLDSTPRIFDTILVGAGSAVAGKYLYNDVIHPRLGY